MKTPINLTNTLTGLTATAKRYVPSKLSRTATALCLAAGIGLCGLAPRAIHADPTDGSQAGDTTVQHGYDDVYRVKYNGGEEGDVHVRADDVSDNQYLEIKVYDPDGNLVTRDFGSADRSPVCQWSVGDVWQWRTYTIKVVNLSYHSIGYHVHFF